MLPGIEMMACQDMAVPMDVMKHVVHVESSNNPFAIGVVGGRLVRQPAALDEALATVRMLEEKGYNFSVGLAQVNRYNLAKYGLSSYEQAFKACPNLLAGSKILAECYSRSGNDWGKSFSCYYSGNFVTGYRHGYVQKVYASIANERAASQVQPIAVELGGPPVVKSGHRGMDIAARRIVPQNASDSTAPPFRAGLLAAGMGNSSGRLRADVIGAVDEAFVSAVTPHVNQPNQSALAADYPSNEAVETVVKDSEVELSQAPERPVMLRAWSERNAPTSEGTGASSSSAAGAAAPVQRGDSAFVF